MTESNGHTEAAINPGDNRDPVDAEHRFASMETPEVSRVAMKLGIRADDPAWVLAEAVAEAVRAETAVQAAAETVTENIAAVSGAAIQVMERAFLKANHTLSETLVAGAQAIQITTESATTRAAQDYHQSAVSGMHGVLHSWERDLTVLIKRLSFRASVIVMAVASIASVTMAGFSWVALHWQADQVAALQAQRATLEAQLAALDSQGARLTLRHCDGRLCVRIDRTGGQYGNSEEAYRVVYGY